MAPNMLQQLAMRFGLGGSQARVDSCVPGKAGAVPRAIFGATGMRGGWPGRGAHSPRGSAERELPEMRTRAQAKEAAAAGEAGAPAPKGRGRARTELAQADTTRDDLVVTCGV